jgi:glutamate/aspartate transport system substrate-binding protein
MSGLFRRASAFSFRAGWALAALAAGALVWTPALSAQSVLERIAQRHAVVLGYTASSPPMSYLGPDGKPIGYTIDICRAVAERLKERLGVDKLAVRFLRMELDTRASMVGEGSVDLVCNGTSNTAGHRRDFAFGPTVYVAETRLVTREDSGIGGLAELRGQKVAVSVGSSAELTLTQIADQYGLEVAVARSNDAAFDQLLLGWAKAFALDDVVLGGLVATSREPKRYRMLPDVLAREAIGIAFAPGDEALDAAVTEAVTDLMASGGLARLYTKWFESPIPPHDRVIDRPMPEALRALIVEPSDRPID